MMTSQKVGPTQSAEDTRPRSTSAKSSFEGKGSPEVNLISLAYSNRAEKIAEYLKKNPALEITAMRDIRHYSVLHIACINNQAKIFQMFCDHVKAQNISEEDFREWVNARTDEGYCAIHFASFKGSLELIRLLEGYGASIDTKNDQGLSVLHIAAQGDHPISLAYFLKKGLDLQELDVKGSTPLHWAAFLGMENATNYLTSWGSDPNLKDSESGFTPLHLAVISGNSRVVRRLLLKGADRRIRDNENKTPKDLALENEYGHIAQLLEGRNWLIECFNIKPGFQRKRTKHSLALLVSLFSVTIFLNLIFLFPYVSDLVWVIFFFLLCGLTITFFIISWQKNPGYMVNKKNDILDLLVRYESYKICPECVLVKPERSKHCDYCGKCVAVFDHHCPWIDNCVGAKNHKYFLMFIFSTLLSVIYFTLLSIFHISQREPVNKYSIIDFEEEAILFDLKEVVCVGNFILTVLFAVPLSILNYVQICNFISGKTTNERFGFNKSGNTNRESVRPGADMTTSLMGGMGSQSITISETPATIRHNKRYKHSFVNNCRAMCFTNAKDYDHAYQSHQSLGIN